MNTYTFTITGVFDAETESEARADLAEWLTNSGVADHATVEVEPNDGSYLCDTCGRIGNADDGIAYDGDDCPDEDCGGTVHRLPSTGDRSVCSRCDLDIEFWEIDANDPGKWIDRGGNSMCGRKLREPHTPLSQTAVSERSER